MRSLCAEGVFGTHADFGSDLRLSFLVFPVNVPVSLSFLPRNCDFMSCPFIFRNRDDNSSGHGAMMYFRLKFETITARLLADQHQHLRFSRCL